LITCKKFFYGEEEKLVDVALQKIENDLDIKNILDKLADTIKLNNILLH